MKQQFRCTSCRTFTADIFIHATNDHRCSRCTDRTKAPFVPVGVMHGR